MGEILLVVIGILIALQINNWNEWRKNQHRIKDNVKGLMVDLRRDSIDLTTSLLRIESDLDLLDGLQNRLTSTYATLDTLIQIARHEFNPVVNRARLENNRTYSILVMSGEINLFDRKIIEEINAYYTLFNKIQTSDDENWNLYLNSVRQYTESFTHHRSLINSGPLDDAIWDNVDLTTLAPKFNSWAGSKRLYYSQREFRLENLMEMNNRLKTHLRENYSQKD